MVSSRSKRREEVAARGRGTRDRIALRYQHGLQPRFEQDFILVTARYPTSADVPAIVKQLSALPEVKEAEPGRSMKLFQD